MTLSSSGLLSGTPKAAGTYVIIITVTDSKKGTASVKYTLTVNP